MGSLSRQNARNRLFDVLDERLDNLDETDIESRESIYNSCIDALARTVSNSVEIDRVSQELASEDSEVEFPFEVPSDQETR